MDELPDDEEVAADLLDVDGFEYEDRIFYTAAIAPHPTAVRSVFELVDGEEVAHRTPPDLIPQVGDPYFWVDVYAETSSRTSTRCESASRRRCLTRNSTPPRGSPVGEVFDPTSPIGRAAYEAAVGARAMTTTLAEAITLAADEGEPDDADAAVFYLSVIVDALMAAAVLEQLTGRRSIPADVIDSWDAGRPDD